MYGAENELDEQPAGEISKFYLNQRKTPKSCLSLDDIYLMDWNELEFNHDYIQLIFPLKFKSESVPEAPTITLAEEAQFQKSKFLQKRVVKSFLLMLDFFGLEMNYTTGEVSRAPHFLHRANHYVTNKNHNYLRITRILSSLRLCGLNQLSIEFFNCLTAIYVEYGEKIGPATYGYWKKAAKPHHPTKLK
jgi:hypothetical protein